MSQADKEYWEAQIKRCEQARRDAHDWSEKDRWTQAISSYIHLIKCEKRHSQLQVWESSKDKGEMCGMDVGDSFLVEDPAEKESE